MNRLFDLSATPIEDGITVVEASAGTGKTYCLVGLVLRLLLERRVSDVSELLVVTFTKAATQELVERLRDALTQTCRLLGGEGESDDPFFQHLAVTYRGDGEALRIAREALVRFDDLTVSTIHGFCLRVLGDSAFESGEPFEAELVENAAPMLLEAARDVWRRLLYDSPARLRPDGAPGIVATVVTEEGLTPESFLADFELSRRHPHTEILPPAPTLDTAIARLRQTRDALRDAWDTTAVRRLLEPRRFLRGAYFAGGALQRRLNDAEAFCRDGESASLRAVLELARERLEPSLFKRDRVGIAKQPVITACTAFGTAISEFRHALRCRFIADVGRRFEADKRSNLTWSYDDLLRRLRRALDDPGRGRALAQAVRRRYRAALIDEFQDTDLIQYQIFHRLFRRGPLVLIGDPKQAIYRFRGADVFAYLAARDGADRVYTLAHNWRTEGPLVEAVNAIFSHSTTPASANTAPPPTRPFVFEQIAFEPAFAARGKDSEEGLGDDHRHLQWIWMPRLRTRELTHAAIEDAVTGEITRLLAGETSPLESKLAPDDIAVLVRTNAQAASLQSALRDAGIPSVIGRSGDIFYSEEMADLETLLTAIADPGDGGRLRAAWATRLWGASAQDIRRLSGDDEAAARIVERFSFFRRDWRRRGFMPMIQQLFAERGVRQRLLGSLAGERRLTNLIHATEVLHRTERGRHLSPAALLGWLASERARDRQSTEDTAPTRLREDTELRLESDAAAVQITTVHRSKGLEYDVVFCPFLWQARTADSQPVQAHVASTSSRHDLEGSTLVLDYGSGALAQHQAQAEAERLSEEARLTYVALTRARRRCYVVWGDVPGKHGPAVSALGYLLHRGRSTAGAPHTEPGKLAEQALAAVAAGREGWYRELGCLIADHTDVMELRTADQLSQAPLRGDGTMAAAADRRQASDRDLEPRRFRGAIPRAWSLQSFSSLSRIGSRSDAAHEAADGKDRDEGARPPLLPLREPEVATPEASPGQHTASIDRPTGILAFARGRRAGSCLHRVLEHCDLARLDNSETEEVIAEALRRFGLDDAQRHGSGQNAPPAGFDPAGAIRDLLHRLADAPLPGADTRLGAVPRTDWLVEWKFTLPLGRITPRRLAQVFHDHGRDTISSEYAARLEALGHTEVHGYLTGFVDLIFSHGGRWFLLDWKSNDLGPNTAAYGQEGMWHAMSHHHYVLQYHLYLVALHRFLRQRIDAYDYRHHLAGAYYVFLRGLESTQAVFGGPRAREPGAQAAEARPRPAQRGKTTQSAQMPRHGKQDALSTPKGRASGANEHQAHEPDIAPMPASPQPTGWYVDRPPLALIEALDKLIGGSR